MLMVKMLRYFGVILFMLVLVAPTIVWFGFVDESARTSQENRRLAEFPNLGEESWDTLFSSLDAWYVDNIPFKNDAAAIKNATTMFFFNEVESPQVLLGSNGYLFYKSKESGDPIGDYKGQLQLSEEQKANFMKSLENAEANLADQDIELCILVAPNRETLYSEYLPEGIKRIGQETQAAQLDEYLRNNGITRYRYLHDVEEGGEYPTYFQIDTHWNDYGAYLGYEAFLEMLEEPPLTHNYQWKEVPSTGGDLAKMLGLGEVLSESNKVRVVGADRIEAVGSYGETIERLQSRNSEYDPRKVLIIGDSFRVAFNKYPANDFSEVLTLHRKEFDTDVFRQQGFKPDIVILLSPERSVLEDQDILEKLSVANFS